MKKHKVKTSQSAWRYTNNQCANSYFKYHKWVLNLNTDIEAGVEGLDSSAAIYKYTGYIEIYNRVIWTADAKTPQAAKILVVKQLDNLSKLLDKLSNKGALNDVAIPKKT